jgi:hypothetical protein
MNIFFLYVDAQEAAQAHCDKHVVKMILESAQLLCTCQHLLRSNDSSWTIEYERSTGRRPCKAAFKNHPCAVWVRRRLANYRWLCDLALALCDEKRHRWPDNPDHVLRSGLEWLRSNPPIFEDAFELITAPSLAMPDECKYPADNGDDSIGRSMLSYRTYYGMKQSKGIAEWRQDPSRKPYWLPG